MKNEFFFKKRTHRTGLQQILKMSTIFSKTNIYPLQSVPNFAKCVWVSVGNRQFNIVFRFLHAPWVIRINPFFEKSPTQRSLAGCGLEICFATLVTGNPLCWHGFRKDFFVVFLQRCRASNLSTPSDVWHDSCRKHCLCPEIDLPIGVLSYSALVC